MVEDVKKLLSGNKGRWTDQDDTNMGIAMKDAGWVRNVTTEYEGSKRTHYVKGEPSGQRWVVKEDIDRNVSVERWVDEKTSNY